MKHESSRPIKVTPTPIKRRRLGVDKSAIIPTVESLANRLGISKVTAYKALHAGIIPSIKIGKRFVIPVAAVDEWLKTAGRAVGRPAAWVDRQADNNGFMSRDSDLWHHTDHHHTDHHLYHHTRTHTHGSTGEPADPPMHPSTPPPIDTSAGRSVSVSMSGIDGHIGGGIHAGIGGHAHPAGTPTAAPTHPTTPPRARPPAVGTGGTVGTVARTGTTHHHTKKKPAGLRLSPRAKSSTSGQTWKVCYMTSIKDNDSEKQRRSDRAATGSATASAPAPVDSLPRRPRGFSFNPLAAIDHPGQVELDREMQKLAEVIRAGARGDIKHVYSKLDSGGRATFVEDDVGQQIYRHFRVRGEPKLSSVNGDNDAAGMDETRDGPLNGADIPAPAVSPAEWFNRIASIFDCPNRHAEYLIDNLLPVGSITALTGASGEGKTTIAIALASAIERGEPFAGMATRRRPVLYLDRENPLGAVVERHERLGVTGISDNYRYWGGWCRDKVPDPTSETVMSWVMATEPRPVIIIDSLIAFSQVDENDATKVRAYTGGLRRLADAGATVILLHHCGKGESTKHYRGTSGFEDSLDIGYVVTNIGPDSSRLDHVR